MATKNVKPDEVASTITQFLELATEEYTDIMKEVIDDIANETVNVTKEHITFNDKEYSKSIALTDEFDTKRSKKKLWYVKKPHYRLTHLLEFGHVTRNGTSRTRSFEFVRYGNDYVQDNFPKELKERIENARLENNT